MGQKKIKKHSYNRECEVCGNSRRLRLHYFDDETSVDACMSCTNYLVRKQILTRSDALDARNPMTAIDLTPTTSEEVEANRPDWHKKVYGGG